MEVEIIQDVETFKDMRLEWNALLDQSSGKAIYLTWEWLFTWWEIFGPCGVRSLFIIAAREGGRLVGIAPFIRRQIKTCGLINRTRLEFLGTGEDEKDEVCSNYMDFIVIPGADDDFVNQVVNTLTLSERYYDEIVLSSIPEDSNIMKSFMELLKGRPNYLKTNVLKTSPCLFIRLPSEWEEYLKALGDKTRRNIRRDRKLLAAKGSLGYQTFCDSEAYKYFDAVVELHKRRWQENRKEDMFSSKMFLGFHEKLSKLFAERGWLKIGILTNNGQRIAASYHLFYKNTLFAYQVGCDDNYDRRVSVGMSEFGFSIEDAIRGKYKEYDFYKASKKGYKALLAKDCRNVIDVRIARNDLVEKLIVVTQKIKTLMAHTYGK